MSTIELRRSAPAALAYHVLAHLPLRRDAASLYDDTLPSRPWVEALLHAYAEAPGRLQLHAMGLWWSRDDRVPEPGTEPPAGLRDDAGRRLWSGFLGAIEHEREGFFESWEASTAEAEARAAEIRDALLEPLSRLRTALWEQIGPTPALCVLDCPALGLAGRASSDARGHLVAVSFAAPIDHLLCQIFHEEVHPVTDPVVREGRRGEAQDTRAGQPGHDLHASIEQLAIDVGRAVIEARAPQWRAAYASWCARFGIGACA